MANELDKLLECIEEEGGFIYACTTAHRGSLETLEDGMKSLSERTRVWKVITFIAFITYILGYLQRILTGTFWLLIASCPSANFLY